MDDMISRQAAIDALAEWHDPAITNRLNNLPTVDAVPVRHGRWEKCLGKELSCKCSVCASKYDIPWRYCPNCGTRMDWKDGDT